MTTNRAPATEYYQLEDLNSSDDENNDTLFEIPGDLHLKSYKKEDQNARCSCVVITSFAVVILSLVISILFLTLRSSGKMPEVVTSPSSPPSLTPRGSNVSSTSPMFAKTPGWLFNSEGNPTESCVRLVDIDGDGRDDVIYGYADVRISEAIDSTSVEELRRICTEKTGHPFCIGYIVGIRGYDGKLLWKLSVQSVTFEINCGNADFNGDGFNDCIAAGRMSHCMAFDPRTGKELWRADQTVLKFLWNIYNPLVLPDMNDDGVQDVLIAHGGDPSFGANEHNRYAGRLILLDGTNGKMIGSRFMNMSFQRETYDSPVMHSTKDGSMYILYGDGGETVDGHFKAISLPDFYRYVMQYDSNHLVPNTKGSYENFKQLKRDENGVFNIYESKGKGVMIPPTLVDTNADGTLDILVSVFDSTYILYDGETMAEIWSQSFKGYESYTQLAPGYFNDDDHIDFMTHLNKGTWPTYNSTVAVILDGADGSVLWRVEGTGMQITSDLVMRTAEDRRDAFLFRLTGVEADVTATIDQQQEEEEAVNKRKRAVNHAIQIADDLNPREDQPPTAPRTKGDQGSVNGVTASLQDSPGYAKVGEGGGARGTQQEEEETRNREQTGANGAAGKKDNTSKLASSETTDSPEVDSDEAVTYKCSESQEKFVYRYLLVDRTTSSSPLVIRSFPGIKYRYNSDLSNKGKGQSADTCIMLNSNERNTGSLGDVDGDGVLDMITLTSFSASVKVVNELKAEYVYEYMRTIARKVNVADLISLKPSYLRLKPQQLWMSADTAAAQTASSSSSSKVTPLHKVAMAPLARQPWTAYMGNKADGVYRP